MFRGKLGRFSSGWRSSRLFLTGLACVLLAIFALYCIALPFITPVVASEGAQLISLQNHYAGYMPGFVRALWGEQATVEVLNYGAGSALLVEGIVRLSALWNVFDVLFAIKTIHLIFLVLLGSVLWVLRPERVLTLLVLMVFASPTLSLLSPVLYYPNLSGIRFVPFVVTIGALAIVSTSRQSHLGPLAFLGGLAVLYAPGTGGGAYSAILTFIFLRAVDARGFRAGIRSTLWSGFLTTMVVVVAPLVRSFFSGAHRETLPSSTFFADFLSGYCGISTWPSPLSTIAFFCGAHAIYRGACRAGSRRLGRWDAYQAAVGFIMLGWLFFYVHLSALRALEPREDYLVLTSLSVEARTLGFNLRFPVSIHL